MISSQKIKNESIFYLKVILDIKIISKLYFNEGIKIIYTFDGIRNIFTICSGKYIGLVVMELRNFQLFYKILLF